MGEAYRKHLLQYSFHFTKSLLRDIQVFDSIANKFEPVDEQGRIKVYKTQIDEIGAASVRTRAKSGLEVDLAFVDDLLNSNDSFKLNMMFAMALAKHINANELRVFNVFEIISIRNLVISLCINDSMSVISAMVTVLSLPVDEIPQGIIQSTTSLDEFIKGVNLTTAAAAKTSTPDSYHDLNSYRDYCREQAQAIIAEVNDLGYFGTYPVDVFTEMLILMKLSPSHGIHPYHTPQIPALSTDVEDLRHVVDQAWKTRKFIDGE